MKNISSDSFIELFITVSQIRHLNYEEQGNLFNANWSFDINCLTEFIFYAKNDYRFKEFLSCFKCIYDNNILYSVDLWLSLNRAKSKHFITGIYNNKAYISRFYVNNRVLVENSLYYDLMNELIDDFEFFCIDKENYIKGRKEFLVSDQVDNSRTILELQRRIVKKYEDEEKL